MCLGQEIPQKRHPGVDFLGDKLSDKAFARLGTVRFRVAHELNCIDYSPDGTNLASASYSYPGELYLWNSTTGERTVIRQIEGSLSSVRFFPDGKRLISASSSSDDPIFLNELTSTKEDKLIKPYNWGDVRALEVSPNGKLVAAGTQSGVVIWDLNRKEIKIQIQAPPLYHFWELAFSPDGQLLAYCDQSLGNFSAKDKIPAPIHLLDINSGKIKLKLEGHINNGAGKLLFSSDGKTLISAGWDNTVRYWDLTKGELIRSVEHSVTALAYSPKENVVASYCNSPAIIILTDTTTGKEIRTINDLGNFWIRTLRFSPDGKRLAAAGNFRAIRFWDVETGQEVHDYPGHYDAIRQVLFSPDGKTLASCSADQVLCIWDVESRKQRHRLATSFHSLRTESSHRSIDVLAFSPDSQSVGVNQYKTLKPKATREIHFWNIATGKPSGQIPEPLEDSSYLSVPSPDGSTLAGCTSKGIRLTSVETKEEVGFLPNVSNERFHRTGAERVRFSPDGRTLAAGCFDSVVRVWNWRSGTLLRQFSAKTVHGVVGLSYSPDGQILAVVWGSHGGVAQPVMHLFDAKSGTLLRQLECPKEESFMAVAISSDGRTLATAGSAETFIRLWDIYSGKEVAKLEGHRGPVRTLAFSPDGATLASGSVDTTVLLWDVRGLNPQIAAANLTAKELDQLWTDLHSNDAVVAFKAVVPLTSGGDKTTAYFKERLKVIPEPDAKRVKALLNDLDNDQPAVRDSATKELEVLGRAVEGALRQRLKGDVTSEVKARLTRLLDRVNSGQLTREEQAALRAVAVLDQIGSSSARELLEKLAAGAIEADLTRQAKQALSRLEIVTRTKRESP
jgi:WD40 repeat protein